MTSIRIRLLACSHLARYIELTPRRLTMKMLESDNIEAIPDHQAAVSRQTVLGILNHLLHHFRTALLG